MLNVTSFCPFNGQFLGIYVYMYMQCSIVAFYFEDNIYSHESAHKRMKLKKRGVTLKWQRFVDTARGRL